MAGTQFAPRDSAVVMLLASSTQQESKGMRSKVAAQAFCVHLCKQARGGLLSSCATAMGKQAKVAAKVGCALCLERLNCHSRPPYFV